MVYNGMITWFHRMKDNYGTQECQVKLAGKAILVECIDGAFDQATWNGSEIQKGHYVLSDSKGGKATLHRIGEELFLEGHADEGYSGGYWMWKIELTESIGSKNKTGKNPK